jgi:tetratricopeptide (TPR) repeat protein
MKPFLSWEWLLKWSLALIILFFTAQAILSNQLETWLHPETFAASKAQRMDKKVASTLRAVAFLGGFKVLAGHLFWIKVIQYYGDAENSITRYAKLYDYCVLASDLNPRFVSIYTYGAAALAFHLKRVDEATQLLEKGIKANPDAPRLKFLLAAIGFQNTDRYDLIIPALREEAGRPDAPTLLVNILANTYEKVGRFQEAIRLWQKVLREAATDEQRIVAGQKLQGLYILTKENKKP